MSDIQFESDNMNFARGGMPGSPGASGGKGMSGWLMRHGLARSDNAAQIILMGFIAFNFLAAIFLLKYFGVF